MGRGRRAMDLLIVEATISLGPLVPVGKIERRHQDHSATVVGTGSGLRER